MLVGMSDHSTTELEVTTLVEIAEAAISHHRYADAAEIYARLASAHRGAVGYLARAYYARGLLFLSQHAYTEARLELKSALLLEPALEPARDALESIATMKLGKLAARR